ncbi:MAG: FAD-dependent oxidoreductase [Holophagales bacterium]|nr:FAD-dependent oxidoreductase [Holophagales bacterium]
MVGGGAAGVELALALERLGRSRACRPKVTVVEAGTRVLPGLSPTVRSIVESVLAARGIGVRAGRRVVRVEARRVVLDDGTYEPSSLTVWLAGAAPPALLARSDVPKDPGGYLLVDDALRAVDGTPVFGAGDCIGIAGHPGLAKAGVYAVKSRCSPTTCARRSTGASSPLPAAEDLPRPDEQRGRPGTLVLADARRALPARLAAQGPDRPGIHAAIPLTERAGLSIWRSMEQNWSIGIPGRRTGGLFSGVANASETRGRSRVVARGVLCSVREAAGIERTAAPLWIR